MHGKDIDPMKKCIYIFAYIFIMFIFAACGARGTSITPTGIKPASQTDTQQLTSTPMPSFTKTNTSTMTQTMTPTIDTSKITSLHGIIAWWPGDGNAEDLIGSNDGLLENGVEFVPGKRNLAFRFDGINDFIKVPRTSSLNVSKISIAFWMMADEKNKMDQCCQGLVTADYYLVELSGGWDPRVGVNFVVNTYISNGFMHTSDANDGGATVRPGEWNFIVGTYDGMKSQLYINGVASGNPAFVAGGIRPMLSNSFLTIGSEDGRKDCEGCIGTRYFYGTIDEVMIFNRAITDNEVSDLYHLFR